MESRGSVIFSPFTSSLFFTIMLRQTFFIASELRKPNEISLILKMVAKSPLANKLLWKPGRVRGMDDELFCAMESKQLWFGVFIGDKSIENVIHQKFEKIVVIQIIDVVSLGVLIRDVPWLNDLVWNVQKLSHNNECMGSVSVYKLHQFTQGVVLEAVPVVNGPDATTTYQAFLPCIFCYFCKNS